MRITIRWGRLSLVGWAGALLWVSGCGGSKANAAKGGSSPTLGAPTAEIKDLKVPESFQADPDSGESYLSNINGSPAAKDGNGFITKLDKDGQVAALAVFGKREGGGELNAPKGLAIHGGVLYVADIDVVRAFPLKAGGKTKTSYPVVGAKFLNDVTTDGKELFVSDTAAGRVWAIKRGEGKVRPVARLAGVNGLCLRGGKLVCVTFPPPGRICEVDPRGDEEQKPCDLTPPGAPFQSLDGVVALADGALVVSDFSAGKIFLVKGNGITELASGLRSPADIGLSADGKSLLVPEFEAGRATIRPLVAASSEKGNAAP